LRSLSKVPFRLPSRHHSNFCVASFSTTYFSDVDSSKLTVTRTQNPKPKTVKEELVFGKAMSDHMLEVDWFKGKGWTAPRIVPFGNLSIHPASSCLHYALECFEGMKAYLDSQGKIRLFRPDKNMARMNNSMKRLDMPGFNGDEFLACIKRLVKEDKDWIPNAYNYSLYIRPTTIATQPTLGVSSPGQLKLFVICSPVGPYYPTGFKPVKLLADPAYCRAWPGGTGANKVGGNYAPGIQAARLATDKGYAQILWLFGKEHYVTEVGTMNQFFFWQRKDGKKELITAPLDGTILPGVTRDSILELARDWKEFEVTERPFTINEVVEAVKEKRMIEAFGAGTAAVVAPVEGFEYEGQYHPIPVDKQKQIGALTQRFADTIMGIQYGRIPHKWSVVVD